MRAAVCPFAWLQIPPDLTAANLASFPSFSPRLPSGPVAVSLKCALKRQSKPTKVLRENPDTRAWGHCHEMPKEAGCCPKSQAALLQEGLLAARVHTRGACGHASPLTASPQKERGLLIILECSCVVVIYVRLRERLPVLLRKFSCLFLSLYRNSSLPWRLLIDHSGNTEVSLPGAVFGFLFKHKG